MEVKRERERERVERERARMGGRRKKGIFANRSL